MSIIITHSFTHSMHSILIAKCHYISQINMYEFVRTYHQTLTLLIRTMPTQLYYCYYTIRTYEFISIYLFKAYELTLHFSYSRVICSCCFFFFSPQTLNYCSYNSDVMNIRFIVRYKRLFFLLILFSSST